MCGFYSTGVTLTAQSKPYFVGSVDVLKTLSTKNASGVAAFPDLGPMGGEIVVVPTLPSDGLPSGYLVLVDGNQIAVGDDGIVLDQSGQADVQLDTQPDNPPSPSLNLWQANMVGLRAERKFAVESLANSSTAYVSWIS
jgi:hypothetical protein